MFYSRKEAVSRVVTKFSPGIERAFSFMRSLAFKGASLEGESHSLAFQGDHRHGVMIGVTETNPKIANISFVP